MFEGILGGAIGAIGQIYANEQTAQSAEDMMAFQREMSNTAYQRAVRDLRKAGLNPMLAYGKPASTPEGAKSEFGNAGQAGVSSAVAAEQNRAAVEKMHAEANAANTQAAVNAVQVPRIQQETLTSQSSASQLASLSRLTEGQLERLKTLTPEELMLMRSQGLKLSTSSNLDVMRESALQKEIPGIVAHSRLLGLQVPRAVNEAGAQDSWWMRNVSPFLPDVLRSTSSAYGLSRSVR